MARRKKSRKRRPDHAAPLWITAAVLLLAVVVTAFFAGRNYSISHAVGDALAYPKTDYFSDEPGKVGDFWRDPFSRPAGPSTAISEVAIVIDDLGPNLSHAIELMDLSRNLTLAVLPWETASNEIIDEATQRGVETILHQPMEPHVRPRTKIRGMLFRKMSKRQIRETLESNLRAYPGVAGINNHMGSAFTEDAAAMRVVTRVLSARGLVFLDSMTTTESAGGQAAQEADLDYYRRDVFLDNESDEAYMAGMWRRFFRKAERNGRAVLIGHGRRDTIDFLRGRIPELERAGLALVPLSRMTPENRNGET